MVHTASSQVFNPERPPMNGDCTDQLEALLMKLLPPLGIGDEVGLDIRTATPMLGGSNGAQPDGDHDSEFEEKHHEFRVIEHDPVIQIMWEAGGEEPREPWRLKSDSAAEVQTDAPVKLDSCASTQWEGGIWAQPRPCPQLEGGMQLDDVWTICGYIPMQTICEVQAELEHCFSDFSLQHDRALRAKVLKSPGGWLSASYIIQHCGRIKDSGASLEHVIWAAVLSELLELRSDDLAIRRVQPLLPGHCTWGRLPTEAELTEGGEAANAWLAGLCCCGRHVIQLCEDEAGCRRVQTALERGSWQIQLNVAHMLHGHVLKLLRSPHGNYVVQKLIEVMPSDVAAFVADEILGHTVATAKDRFGCRAICRLLEYSPSHPSTRAVVECILQEDKTVRDLSTCEFSRFVIEHLLKHGLPEDARRVGLALQQDLTTMAAHRFASYVVEEAMKQCEHAVHDGLVHYLVQTECVRALARSRRGVSVLGAVSRRSAGLRSAVLLALPLDRQRPEEIQKMASTKLGRSLLEGLGLLTSDPDEAAGPHAVAAE